MKRNPVILLIVSVLMCFIVLLSPTITSETVNDADDLKKVTFGFPIPFVTQDLSAYDPPFPYEISLSSPWENPTSVNFIFLFASFLIVLVPVVVVYSYLRK